MKSFTEWLSSATNEVKALPELGQKLSYAMYKSRQAKWRKAYQDFKEQALDASFSGDPEYAQ